MTTTPSEPSPDPTVVPSGDPSPESNPDPDDGATEEDRRRRLAAVDDELDAQAEGEGLAAEAGRGEEAGLAEG